MYHGGFYPTTNRTSCAWSKCRLAAHRSVASAREVGKATLESQDLRVACCEVFPTGDALHELRSAEVRLSQWPGACRPAPSVHLPCGCGRKGSCSQ